MDWRLLGVRTSTTITKTSSGQRTSEMSQRHGVLRFLFHGCSAGRSTSVNNFMEKHVNGWNFNLKPHFKVDINPVLNVTINPKLLLHLNLLLNIVYRIQ